MKRFVLIAIVFLFAALEARSQSFTARISSGDQLCFQITDSTRLKVEIVRIKGFGNVKITAPSGELVIPAIVKYKEVEYLVTSVGEDAFADATELTSVSIPSTVRRLGSRAFSGCTSLKSIVFPSSKPEMGENVFEKCNSLSSLSFGSDWTGVDLQVYAESDSLTNIYIPARANQITGLKALASLEKIEVDVNNTAFSSYDGVLYSKDGRTLYTCPSAKSGEVNVRPGTEKILDGAFRDCTKVGVINLPSSLHEFAFDEFAGCSSLARLTLLSAVPPVSAKWGGATVFAVESPNTQCSLFVPKEYFSRYKVSICTTEGIYETLNGNRQTELVSGQLMGKTAIKKKR